MTPPSVSIIVLTCNQKSFTLDLLASLSQWMKENPDSELIIVDNGSDDGTKSLVENCGLIDFCQLSYLYNSRNLGVAAGRNIGLRKAKKDYILFLDNDTLADADSIDTLRNYLIGHPSCGLVAPALRSEKGEIQHSAKPFPGLGIKLRHLLLKKNPAGSENEAMESRHPYYVIGACQMFRRSVIDEIGVLDEKIFYGPEDADWCERIRQTQKTIDYLPEVSIIHHWQRASNHSPLSRLSRLHIKALLYFYRKMRRWW